MTYFFLKSAPLITELDDGWVRLQSSADNIYDCQIIDNTVSFRWISKSNTSMTSNSTKWSMRDGRLIIVSDIMTQTFERSSDGLKLLD